MSRKTAMQHAEDAARAQSNLNAWGAVVGLLEAGTLSGGNTRGAKQRVIKIAQAEMQKFLRKYDAALARVAAISGSQP